MTFEEVDLLQQFFAESFISISAIGQESWETARAKINSSGRLPAGVQAPAYDELTAQHFNAFLRLVFSPHKPLIENDILLAKELWKQMSVLSVEFGATLDDQARARGAQETARLKPLFAAAGPVSDPGKAGWGDVKKAELVRVVEMLEAAKKHTFDRGSFWAIAVIAAGIVVLTAIFMSREGQTQCASACPS